MPSSQIERKLAAIMFTDIAGYTAQMSKDEAVAISLINKKESVLKPLIAKHNGTYVKSTGDGSLSHFNSAVDAAMCAKRLQESIYDDKDLNVRVGVHLGDTIFEKGDIRGDGVNIASRLESMAVEGGVFVSKEVYDQLTNQKAFEGVSLGMQSMKGVGRLIEVYGLKGDKLSEPNPKEYQDNQVTVHSDDEVPSIAIIPFRNKGKEEDEFYAYGICADLISDCSRAGLIRVASLEEIEELGDILFKKKAERLFVRYVATGTLWKIDEIFQLSIELFDTRRSKVIWSDRWQEKWDNLPSIKGSLSEGLLKALDTTSKEAKKVETTNTEAYEFYLKAKYKYKKRKTIEDTEITRGLLKKAIELDDNLILAKVQLGITYDETGNYDEAMGIFNPALKQAEKLNDKLGMGVSLLCIGSIYNNKGNYDTALEYYTRSIRIAEELGDKKGIGYCLIKIGIVYWRKDDYKKSLDYYNRGYKIFEELDNKRGMGACISNIGIIYSFKRDYDKVLDYYNRGLKVDKELGNKRGEANAYNNIGVLYSDMGDFTKALDYYGRSLNIRKALSDKQGIETSLYNIGVVYFNKFNYKKAEKYFNKSLDTLNEIGRVDNLIWSTTYFSLTCKYLDKEYDEKVIHKLIKEAEDIDEELNYRLSQLLEDTSYLETAYNQIQEKASAMEEELSKKFLSYPIPAAIVEEWEKVK